jgi:hypothetical protein
MPAHRARFLQAWDSIARRVHEQALLPASLVAQIEECRRSHLAGALDDAKQAALEPGE